MSIENTYANRGKKFEELIELSNQQYLYQKRALIQKIPTPVKVLDINKLTGKLKGFYDKKSTVDYIGVFKSYSLAFDAKSTKVKTRFDLSNVKEHQFNYLKNHKENGGISFLIIEFLKLDEVYLLPFEVLEDFWEKSKKGGRKSIPYKDIAKKNYLVESKNAVIFDYLSVIELNY